MKTLMKIIGMGIILFGISSLAMLEMLAYNDRHRIIDPSISETVNIRDINFLLDKEGYKIYFRITEEGQLSLVHPRGLK